MPLNIEQKNIINTVDKKVKALIARGSDEQTILVEMLEYMPGMKTIISLPDKSELDFYLQGYDGFYSYMKILERLALGIANGTIPMQR